MLAIGLALFGALPRTAPVASDPSPAPNDTLSFEVRDAAGGVAGWWGGLAGTLFPDSTVVHSGRFAARLERVAASPEAFSSVSRTIPANVSGDTLVLRGWLRTDGVQQSAGFRTSISVRILPISWAIH